MANGNSSGQVVVTISQTDAAFETTRCGGWTMISGPAPATATPASLTGTPWPGTSLSQDVRGQPRHDVALVQRRLNQLGYGPMPVDGYFGPVTESWVRKYQADTGLFVDGVVGPVTWRSLFG
ncbi:MAG: peptidoglycan-binding protein [Propionibacteriales bacterium]|nr:peptidoglycan-binding protein [Propionibacteriales bacterium]